MNSFYLVNTSPTWQINKVLTLREPFGVPTTIGWTNREYNVRVFNQSHAKPQSLQLHLVFTPNYSIYLIYV